MNPPIAAFAIHFYRSLMNHKYEVSVSGIRELEILRAQINQEQMNENESREQHSKQDLTYPPEIRVDVV